MKYKMLILIIFLIAYVLPCYSQESSKKYTPNPILMIHGFGGGEPKDWNNLRDEIRDRKLLDNSKYETTELLYSIADYRALNNGSIEQIANLIEPSLTDLYNAHGKSLL